MSDRHMSTFHYLTFDIGIFAHMELNALVT